MSVAAPTGGSHRARALRALGVTAWHQRAVTVAGPVLDAAVPVGAASGDAPAPCVVLVPANATTRALDVLGRALLAAGGPLARAARIRVAADGTDIPPAAAYLACGDAQAHALGRSVPGDVTAVAQIVLADVPDHLLHEADAKRRLWIALRTLRRALAAGH